MEDFTMNKTKIGHRIQLLRKLCGMTQAQLAEKTRVSTDHVSHVEIGAGNISLAFLLRICKALEIAPNDILAGEYESETPQKEYLRKITISLEDLNPANRILLYQIYQVMSGQE